MKRRIFLVDDHPLVREWLTNLLNQQDDLIVCGEATNAQETLEKIASSGADLAIVDLALKTTQGLDLIKELHTLHPNLLLIVLTMHEESIYAERALHAGASGFVMKDKPTSNIIVAIHRVLGGGTYLSDEFAARLAERQASLNSADIGNPVEILDQRELDVFKMLGSGKTTSNISETLNISLKTVQSYSMRIKEKLHLSDSEELLHEAARWHKKNTSNP